LSRAVEEIRHQALSASRLPENRLSGGEIHRVLVRHKRSATERRQSEGVESDCSAKLGQTSTATMTAQKYREAVPSRTGR